MDKEKTRAYYAAPGPEDLCSRAYCRDFSARVREAYPDLAAFPEGMGVEIAKPFEAWPLEPHFVVEAGPFRLEWPGEAPE